MDGRKLYSDDGIFGRLDYGGPGVSRGLMHSAFITSTPFILRKIKKALVIGGGNNYETVLLNKKGIKTYALDLRIPRIKFLKGKSVEGDCVAMPFRDKEFDLVFCTEMMEHVPEESANAVLMEVKRVGHTAYFTIATRDDAPFDTHVNVHDLFYWVNKFDDLGFGIKTAAMNPIVCVNMGGGLMGVSYPDGAQIYAEC